MEHVNMNNEVFEVEIENGVALPGRQPRRDGVGDGAALPRSDARAHEVDAIGKTDADPVTGANTEVDEGMSQPIRVAFEFPARRRRLFANHGDAIGIVLRQSCEYTAV